MNNSGFRHAMTWLHTWSGLLLGWILFAIFVTGTASYFRPEITAWMQPEAPRAVSPLDAARHAFAHLEEIAPDAPTWGATLPDARTSELRVFWRGADRRFQNAKLDPVAGGPDAARATAGGEFFYRFHFQLMLPHPWGRWIACIAAMFMLVALVSGVATHRRLLADMFLFRRTRDGRRPWLDFHNVTAVVALPYYLLIAYSALVIFTAMYMPWPGLALGAEQKAKPAPAAVASASAVPSASLDEMLRVVGERWGDARSAKRIEITERGTAKATVTFTRADGPEVALHERETLKFSGVTGELLDAAAPVGPGRAVAGWLYGFHLARFAEPSLRAMFFLLGLLGCAMTGTGLALWTLKRRERLASAGRGGRFGYRLVSRLNVAFVAGFVVACGAYFWANRLLPADLAGREKGEVAAVLWTWAALTLHAFARPERAAWREQFIVGAAIFGGLPVLDLLTGGRPDGLHAGFAAAFFGLAALFAYGARKLSARPPAAPKGSA